MALVSKRTTKPATVPFKLLDLSDAIRRDFFDIMPLKDLYVLRESSNIVKSLSCFRGEIVEDIKIEMDNTKEKERVYCWGWKRFDDIMNSRFNTTPLKWFEIHMCPDIRADVLLSKMEAQYYYQLCLLGSYDWKAVVALLHAGVETVELYGIMELPAENMKEFFNTFFRYKVKTLWIITDNYAPSLLLTAKKVFDDAGYTTEYITYDNHYHPEVVVTSGDEKIRFFGPYVAYVDNEFSYYEYETDEELDENL